MDLMPKQLRTAFPEWRSTERSEPADVPVIVKYFTPDAGASWWITEAIAVLDDENGTEVPVAECYRQGGGRWYHQAPGSATISLVEDIRMFGLCDLGLGFPELGYVSLDELCSLRGKMGLPVEIDLHWRGSLADAQAEVSR